MTKQRANPPAGGGYSPIRLLLEASLKYIPCVHHKKTTSRVWKNCAQLRRIPRKYAHTGGSLEPNTQVRVGQYTHSRVPPAPLDPLTISQTMANICSPPRSPTHHALGDSGQELNPTSKSHHYHLYSSLRPVVSLLSASQRPSSLSFTLHSPPVM